MENQTLSREQMRAVVGTANEQRAQAMRARSDARRGELERDAQERLDRVTAAGGEIKTDYRGMAELVPTPEEKLERAVSHRLYGLMQYEGEARRLRAEFVNRLRGEVAVLTRMLADAEAAQTSGDWRHVYTSDLTSSNRGDMARAFEKAEMLEKAIADLAEDLVLRQEIALAAALAEQAAKERGEEGK